jgi:CRP/FNR family transcriptional regulator, cyclic AMP receptor protein
MTMPITATPEPDQFNKVSVKTGSTADKKGNVAAQSLYALVAQQPFFKGVSAQQLQLLTDSAMEMQFEAGQAIFHEGSSANRFYLILEGKVVLETKLEEHGIFQIQTLGPGDDLGWSWLFPPYLLNASARALESTRTIFFYGTRLRKQCEQNHDLGYQLMRRIAEVVIQRFQATQQRLTEIIVTNNLPNP